MNPHDLARKVEDFLVLHPKATLVSTAEALGFSKLEIEQALLETEGVSFPEFLQNWKLRQAFKELGADRDVLAGPWEKPRLQPRRIIPRTTVRFRVRSFWRRKQIFSCPCPLVDLSGGGLGFLSDEAPPPGKRVSLMLKFPVREKELPVEGKVVYTVATGIAGFRHRVGIQFLKTVDSIEEEK